MGLYLIKTEKKGKTTCVIGADSQAAIQALESELTNPGQHLAAEFLEMARQIARSRSGGKSGESRYKLTVRWTAGHVGIKGNEKADKEAKSAAAGQNSKRTDLPPYVRKSIKSSTSALKQAYNKKANEAWKREWVTSERHKRLPTPDTVPPASKKFLTLTSDDNLSRKRASLLFQLRVGHAPLNNYLFRFKKVDSARCPACGAQKETTEHFILRCPNFEHERWPLLQRVKDHTPKLEQILSDPKLMIPLFNYIDATERFKVQAG
jgi:hypothetical protein